MSNGKNIAQKMFGRVKKKPTTNDHVVDFSRLDFSNDPEAAIKLFCVGCGSYHNLTKLGASSYVEQLGVEPGTDLANHYFQASSCTACANDYVVTALKAVER